MGACLAFSLTDDERIALKTQRLLAESVPLLQAYRHEGADGECKYCPDKKPDPWVNRSR